MRVAVVGAGIAGLGFALAASRRGLEVTVLERPLAPRLGRALGAASIPEA